ncbi:WD repeat-containing protein 53 [Lingula anatina]|uniref:WD repeat-containing protein 53 n=1 Tax=Lingula anatina TaxID=7574 RepID=A0A1S3IH47_LINAN|nr:WD repeat-containing protein 53 [Lingula anatina]|eukprot:XP_013396809.1 WD repeat-containing protein 53 [Lingula anatina]
MSSSLSRQSLIHLSGHNETVLCLDVHPDGQLVSGAEQGEIIVWNTEGKAVTKICSPNQEEDVASVCSSKSNQNMVYSAAGQGVFIYDLRSGTSPVHQFEINEDEVNQVTVNEQGTFLAACDDANTIKVINLQERKVYKTLCKHSNICSSVCFRPQRPWELLSGGFDCNLIHWDFSRGRAIKKINMQEIGDEKENATEYFINPPFIHSIALTPDGSHTACGLENGKIQIMTSSKKQLEAGQTLYGHTQGVSSVDFTPQGSGKADPPGDGGHAPKLISGGNDCQIRIWTLLDQQEDGNPEWVIADSEKHVIQHTSKINCVCSWGSDNSKILVADQTNQISMYSVTGCTD